jgi:Tol biopolymer transport system component
MRQFTVSAALLLSWSLSLPATNVVARTLIDESPVQPFAQRTLAFSTESGTWLSLDVFADGRGLVFDLLGDLYLLPMSGGKATPLTRGPAFDSQPALSPDGRWVAFISDRDGAENLWIARTDGSASRQLTHDEWGMFASPAWHPNGKSVVVSRTLRGYRTGYELVEFDLTGKELARHSTVNQTEDARSEISAVGASFDNEGKFLYYARRIGRHPRNVSFPIWAIHRVDLKNGEDVRIVTEPGSAFRPRLSGDGRWLAYATRLSGPDGPTALKLMDLTSHGSRVLLSNLDRDDQESEDFNRDILPGFSFTPDSTAIVLATGGKLRRLPLAGGAPTDIAFRADVSLTLANPGVQGERPELTDSHPVRLFQSLDPAPDGTSVVLSALGSLYLHDTRAMTVRKLATPTNAFHPRWSIDGHSLLYVSWNPNEGGALWRLNVTAPDAAPVKITRESAYYAWPVQWPDGSIVVQKTSTRNQLLNVQKSGAPVRGLQLVRISPDDGSEQVLTDAPPKARFYYPQLGKAHRIEGDTRVFFHAHDGLMAFAPETRQVTPVFSLEQPFDEYMRRTPRPADDIRVSPRGDFYVAKIAEQLYLVPRSADKEPLRLTVADGARKLTRYGVDQMEWSSDGRTVYWSLGNELSMLAVGTLNARSLPTSEQLRKSVRSRRVDIPLPRPDAASSQKLVLKGATILPMTGAAAIKGHAIVIAGNRIAAIVPEQEAASISDARFVDVSGKYILPGFIDLHAHWSVLSRDGIAAGPVSPFLANLAYGVTATRDPQSFTTDLFAYADLVESGALLAPRLFTTGPAIQSDIHFESPQEVRDVITRFRDYYRTNTVKFYLAGNRGQRRMFITEANRLGMRVTSESARNFKWDFTMVLDGADGQEHPIPHAPLYQDVVEVYARSGIVYTPVMAMTPATYSPLNLWTLQFKPEDHPRVVRFVSPNIVKGAAAMLDTDADGVRTTVHPVSQAAAARAIVEAGGHVGVGAHALRHLQGLRFHWEMWTLHADGQGMSAQQVLTAATRTAAQALGLERQLGTIEAGKLADLVVLERNPLDDLRNTASVLYTISDGRLLNSATLEQLWPASAPAPRLWWHDTRAEGIVTQ